MKFNLESAPSQFKGVDLPVEQVSWHEAVEFCDRLAQQTRRPYRLPSEAEWEYACRAGTTTPFCFGGTITPELANYNWDIAYRNGPTDPIRPNKTTSVGAFPPNGFGLYDMHGNVWEWCEDDWHVDYEDAPADGSAWIGGSPFERGGRVLRGGSWLYLPRSCRSASRRAISADTRNYNDGLRVVCSVPRTQ